MSKMETTWAKTKELLTVLNNAYGTAMLVGLLIIGLGLLGVKPWLSEHVFRARPSWRVFAGTPGVPTSPVALAISQSGEILVVDSSANRVIVVSPGGIEKGSWGGPGVDPGQFKNPSGIALDNAGNVYVADTGNNRIQKFSSTGEPLRQWGRLGAQPGEFNSPTGIALDSSGDMFVADSGNNRIQKMLPGGGIVATWGKKGSNKGEFDSPYAIKLDGQGNIYVSDLNNHRIQKLSNNGSFLFSWSACSCPTGFDLDREGHIIVANRGASEVLMLSPTADEAVATFGGEGDGRGEFQWPAGVAVGQDNELYVLDTGNHRIQVLDENTGQFFTEWTFAPRTDLGIFSDPRRAVVDPNGYLYVVDGAGKIARLTPDGQVDVKWGSVGSGPDQLRSPSAIALDSRRRILYVADTWNDRIARFDIRQYGVVPISLDPLGRSGSGGGEFHKPYGLTLDKEGNLYVADTYNHRVQKIGPDGQALGAWGTLGDGSWQFNLPFGVAIDSKGRVLVADFNNGRIVRFEPYGNVPTWVNLSANAGISLSGPWDVAIDAQEYIYVADTFNNRIVKMSIRGEVKQNIPSLGTEHNHFRLPTGIVISPSGAILVVDSGNQIVHKFSP